MRSTLHMPLRLANVAVAGEQLVANMVGEAATEVDPLYERYAFRNVCILWGGTNDIQHGGLSGAAVYSAYVSYCQARRAVGWKNVAVTILPRSDAGAYQATFETQRQAFNTLVRANWATFADALADVAADSRMGDAGDELDTTYYSGDQVHPSAGGYAVIGSIMATALNAIGVY